MRFEQDSKGRPMSAPCGISWGAQFRAGGFILKMTLLPCLAAGSIESRDRSVESQGRGPPFLGFLYSVVDWA